MKRRQNKMKVMVLGQEDELIETTSEIMDQPLETTEDSDLTLEEQEAWDAEMESLRALNSRNFKLHLTQGLI